MGEIGTINNALRGIRNNFLEQTLRFSDYYLGNRAIHERIAHADTPKRVGILNGLLGIALEDELNDLWGNLNANTKKMIVQDSAQAVLTRIQQDTGVIGIIHNVNITNDVNTANY